MPRIKVKDAILPIELQIQIQAEFPKLMQFYQMSGLVMDQADFYAVVRGDECLPANVTAVELAYTNVIQLNGMTEKELVLAAQAHLQKNLFERDPDMRRLLQTLVGKLMFGSK